MPTVLVSAAAPSSAPAAAQAAGEGRLRHTSSASPPITSSMNRLSATMYCAMSIR